MRHSFLPSEVRKAICEVQGEFFEVVVCQAQSCQGWWKRSWFHFPQMILVQVQPNQTSKGLEKTWRHFGEIVLPQKDGAHCVFEM